MTEHPVASNRTRFRRHLIRFGILPALLAGLITQGIGAQATNQQNGVLELRGDYSHLSLPKEVVQGVESVTVEGWYNWHRFLAFSPGFCFGKPYAAIGLNNIRTSPTVQFYRYDAKGRLHTVMAPNVLKLDHWYHIAAVAGTNGMKLYINGMLVGQNSFTAGLEGMLPESEVLVGGSVWENTRGFAGQIDRFRVWNRELAPVEIQKYMHQPPEGNEPSLIASYDFDNERGTQDAGPQRYHAKLVAHARIAYRPLPTADEALPPALLTGRVTDSTGRSLARARLVFQVGGEDEIRLRSEPSGHYRIIGFPSPKPATLGVTWHELGVWRTNINLLPGTRRTLDLTLQSAVNLSGRVASQSGDPLAELIVQALREADGTLTDDPEVISSTRTDDKGRYQFVNLKPGSYQLRCLAPGAVVYYRASPQPTEVTSQPGGDLLTVQQGRETAGLNFLITLTQRGNWRTFNFMDALPANNVFSMAQDAEGFLWIGTAYSGMIRFDGKEWIAITPEDGLPHDRISAIVPAADNTLWLATGEGVVRYRDGRVDAVYSDTNGLPHAEIRCLLADGDDALWVGTDDGLAHLQSDQITQFFTKDGLAGDVINAVVRDRYGAIWIGTDSGISRRHNGTFETLTTSDGLAGNRATCLLASSDGRIWVGTKSKGVSIYDGKSFENFTTEEGLVDDRVQALYQAADGSIWIATVNGVTRYHEGALTTFRAGDGPPVGDVRSLFQTRDGVIWLGTRGGGLTSYEDKAFQYWTTDSGLPANSVTGLARAPGGPLWVGTAGGVARLENSNLKSFTSRDGLIRGDRCKVAVTTDGIVWTASENGVSQIIDDEVVSLDQDSMLSKHEFRDVVPGEGANVWFAAYGHGLIHFDGTQAERYEYADELGGRFLTAIHLARDGTLWAASRLLMAYRQEKVVHYSSKDGLNTYEIQALATDHDGRLWLGTTGGLLRQEGDRFIPVAPGTALDRNWIYDIKVALNGRIWLGTAAGAMMFDGTTWSQLDTRDGLPGNDVQAILCDPDGTVWLGSEKGLLRYQPQTNAPSVRFRDVRSRETYTDLKNLPPLLLDSPISIAFSSLDLLTHSDKRLYRCQLVHLGDRRGSSRPTKPHPSANWQPAVRQAQFEWIPEDPGWYQFAVQSIDRDLNYSAPAYLWLRVVTPWYANQWILLPVCALVAILGAGTIVSTWRYVVKHRESQLAQVRVQAQEAFSRDILDQQEEERKRIAAELHDSLGQTLLVLKNRALLGLRSLANPSRLESQLTEISDNASQAITETRQIAFNLRPHQLDSLGLDRGIQAMANKMCQAADLKLVADLDDVSGLLTSEHQTHIFRIVQESLNNVVKHAKATRVMVTLKRRENELHLRIEDNGVGISNGRKDPRSLGGSGRANIAKRVDYLNGVLRTESDPDRGTTIDITIPLPEPVES